MFHPHEIPIYFLWDSAQIGSGATQHGPLGPHLGAHGKLRIKAASSVAFQSREPLGRGRSGRNAQLFPLNSCGRPETGSLRTASRTILLEELLAGASTSVDISLDVPALQM